METSRAVRALPVAQVSTSAGQISVPGIIPGTSVSAEGRMRRQPPVQLERRHSAHACVDVLVRMQDGALAGVQLPRPRAVDEFAEAPSSS